MLRVDGRRQVLPGLPLRKVDSFGANTISLQARTDRQGKWDKGQVRRYQERIVIKQPAHPIHGPAEQARDSRIRAGRFGFSAKDYSAHYSIQATRHILPA